MDKAIRKKDSKLSLSNENESFLYGGDFGDKPYDAMAALGGVFNPDRHPYPSADEMKKAYQELSIIPTIDLGKKEMDFIGFRSYSVKNKHFFRPLNFLQLTWELSENGLLVEQGTLALPAILPRSQSQIDIPFKMHNPNPKSEFYLLLKLTLKEATRWAPAGYLIAFQQIAISNELLLQEYTTKSGTLIKSEESPVYPLACYATKNEFIQKLEIDSSPDSTLITVLGSKFKVTFDTLKGSIVFIEANKIPLFEGIMEPNFIRAFHEDIPMEYGIWMSENQMDRKVKSAHISRDAFDCIRFYAIHQVNDFDELGRGDDFLTEFHHEVRVFGNGEIEVHNWCTPKSRIIRFGMTMPNTIPAKFHRLEWYGRGPIDKNSLGESYPDRVQACPVGRYSSIIDERFCRYSKPQENGGITDVRWLAIMDSQKNGLLLSTNQKLTVSIWSYTQDDLFKAKHLDELPDREKLTLNVDLAHLGFPPSKSLMPQKYEYSFRIKFLNSALGDLHKFSSDENCQSK
jgi:beta-galactosidase/beta-glucuronidase